MKMTFRKAHEIRHQRLPFHYWSYQLLSTTAAGQSGLQPMELKPAEEQPRPCSASVN